MEPDPPILAQDFAVTTGYLDAPQSDLRLDVKTSDQFQPLDSRNIRLEQIASLIFSTVMLTGMMIALLVVWLNLGFGLIWYCAAGGAALIVAILFLSAWRWPPLAYRYASWRLDDEGLEIRRGVLWRHQITIPLGRVQHADVSQGPFQRMFELGTLTVHTAGTQNASVELQGLKHETAIGLRDLIVQQRKDQHVV